MLHNNLFFYPSTAAPSYNQSINLKKHNPNMKQFNLIFIFFTYMLATPVVAFLNENFFQGKYTLKNDTLQMYTNNSNPQNYGIFTIDLGNDQKVVVPDLLYPVGNNRMGTRVLPVVDEDLDGSIAVDKLLNEIMYGNADAQKEIFSVILYNHPEIYASPFEKLNDALRTEMGITHAGAYIGGGRTRNAPVDYNDRMWEVAGYPAHIYAVSLKGENQEVINNNILVSLRILNGHNGGPVFPKDYKFDYFRTFNLKEVLDFYRAWIDPEFIRADVNQALGFPPNYPYIKLLKEHAGFKTYCNEHITIAINLGLNLVHTRQGYIDIWGEKVGSDLFKKAQTIFKEVTQKEAQAEAKIFNLMSEEEISQIEGKEIPFELLENFSRPLWKRRIGVAILPLYNNQKIENFSLALAWKPETTADIMADFIRLYANFTKVTVVRSSFAILSFAKEIYKRLGILPDEFNNLAMQFIEKMIKQDIRLQSSRPSAELNGFTVASLRPGHPVKKIFENKYFAALTKGFAPLLLGKSNLQAGIKSSQSAIKELKSQLALLEAKLGADESNKDLIKKIKELKEQIKDLQAAILVMNSQIKLIPPFEKMLGKIKLATPKLTHPKNILSNKSLSNQRKTAMMLKLNEDIPDVAKLSLDDLAWMSFAIDVHKKDGTLSLMDQARNIQPKVAFNLQFDKKTKYVQYYSPPSIIHKIALNLYRDKDADVIITALGTAFDQEEVEEKIDYDRQDDNIDELTQWLKRIGFRE